MSPNEAKNQFTLVKNVSIFDGKNEKLITGKDLVLNGNLISKFIPTGGDEAAYGTVIDGKGKFLMPGLIDAHTHLALNCPPPLIENMRTLDYIGGLTMLEAERYLMRGFTAVRDVAGPTFSTKSLIDDGLGIGPRIYSSGMGIAQTAGHGDMRNWNSKSRYFDSGRFNMVNYGFFFLADGIAEVQKACRETLAKQASQIKICTGGGVTSLTDPLESVQYTPEEVRAAVLEAERYGTYVCAHVHSDGGVKVALQQGVKSIEHGLIMSEDAMKMLVDHDAWICPQAYIVSEEANKGNPTFANPIQKAKMDKARAGSVNVFKWAKQYGAKVAWGTDMFGNRKAYDSTNLEFKSRAAYYSNAEQLAQATSANGRLLALSNMKNPYTDGPLGVIEEGAYADMLIIDGNPIDDIMVMLDYENNFKMIMKDGKVYKNTL